MKLFKMFHVCKVIYRYRQNHLSFMQPAHSIETEVRDSMRLFFQCRRVHNNYKKHPTKSRMSHVITLNLCLFPALQPHCGLVLKAAYHHFNSFFLLIISNNSISLFIVYALTLYYCTYMLCWEPQLFCAAAHPCIWPYIVKACCGQHWSGERSE